MFHLFIVNPAAGKYDSSKELISEIRQFYKHENYEIILTEYTGHAQKISAQYVSKYEEITVYACGGDGTVNEVLNGIGAYSHANLAIIPIGSGNDFVRNLNVSYENVGHFLTANIQKTDLLQVANYLALNVISIGFDASVAKNFARFRKFGKQAYNLSVAYSLMSSMKHRCNIIIEDRLEIPNKNFLMIVFANGQYYGGGMHVSPYSNICDGLLNFIAIKTISRFQVPHFMNLFVKGRHIDELKQYIDTLECSKVTVKHNKLIDVNIDGEIVSMRDPEIKILPSALNLVIPQNN